MHEKKLWLLQKSGKFDSTPAVIGNFVVDHIGRVIMSSFHTYNSVQGMEEDEAFVYGFLKIWKKIIGL